MSSENPLFPNETEPPQSKIDPAKMARYLEVFQSAYECAFWASDAGLYMTGLNVNLALAVLDAHLAGLTREEIKAAVEMGESHGMPCDQNIGSHPKVERPRYWEQVEAEAHAYWHERLRLSDEDDLYNE